MAKVLESVQIDRDVVVAASSYLSLLMHRVGIRDWGKYGLCDREDIEGVILALNQELHKR